MKRRSNERERFKAEKRRRKNMEDLVQKRSVLEGGLSAYEWTNVREVFNKIGSRDYRLRRKNKLRDLMNLDEDVGRLLENIRYERCRKRRLLFSGIGTSVVGCLLKPFLTGYSDIGTYFQCFVV